MEWDFACYSVNVRNRQKMRQNFELKTDHQENYYLFRHKTGDAEQLNQEENALEPKTRMQNEKYLYYSISNLNLIIVATLRIL